jgi:hypothetical protein
MAWHPPCFSWRAAGTGGLLPQRHPCSIQGAASPLVRARAASSPASMAWHLCNFTSSSHGALPCSPAPFLPPFFCPWRAGAFPSHGEQLSCPWRDAAALFFSHLAVLSWPPAAMAWTPFFSWRSSKLPHGRRPGKLPQWRQQQGSLPPPHGAQKIAARLLCTSSPWSRFCAELRAGACHGQICPLHGCPLLFPAPSSLYPAPPFFPWKTNSEPPSSLFVVVPAGCSAKCAATRALPARCFVKPSGQHAADAHRGLLFLRSPVVVVVHPR